MKHWLDKYTTLVYFYTTLVYFEFQFFCYNFIPYHYGVLKGRFMARYAKSLVSIGVSKHFETLPPIIRYCIALSVTKYCVSSKKFGPSRSIWDRSEYDWPVDSQFFRSFETFPSFYPVLVFYKNVVFLLGHFIHSQYVNSFHIETLFWHSLVDYYNK